MTVAQQLRLFLFVPSCLPLLAPENYERLEADKKKQVHKKHQCLGPTIRYHSVLMPLVAHPALKEENVDVEGYEEAVAWFWYSCMSGSGYYGSSCTHASGYHGSSCTYGSCYYGSSCTRASGYYGSSCMHGSGSHTCQVLVIMVPHAHTGPVLMVPHACQFLRGALSTSPNLG